MYHELTEKKLKRRRRLKVAAVLAAAVLVVLLGTAWGIFTAQAREQGATSVREAILDTAMQCCAIEGSYPQSLTYLEENYGLQINRNDYVITYEAFAGNILPSVVVVPR